MAATLHIGLDVDGVLADYMSAIRAVGRAHGHVTADHGPTVYDLVEPGWFPDAATAGAAMDELRHNGGLAGLALLDDTAAEAVADLRRAGHRVSIVTARAEHPMGRTVLQRWLDRHRIVTDGVHFAVRKGAIGCDVYLDDAAHNVEELRRAGHHAVVRDTAYNRGVDGPRVRSVAEFAELVHAGRFHPLSRGQARAINRIR